MLVDTKADLVNPATWRQLNGDIWVYQGMIVAVAADSDPNNNGIYVLMGSNYTLETSWEKQATNKDITSLQQQIDDLELSGNSFDVEVDFETDLPLIGDTNTTYYVKETSQILRWDEDTNSYQIFGGTDEVPDLDKINLIFGGNAHGTN